MAPGADFTMIPHEVEIIAPYYSNAISASESMKKEFFNLSATPIERYNLKFLALTSTELGTLRTHYKDNSGGYYPFTWKSVPTYIDAGANITGRWVDGSFTVASVAGLYWSCNIAFEKST